MKIRLPHRLRSALFIALFAGTIPSFAADPKSCHSQQLKVLTWNIWHGHHSKPENFGEAGCVGTRAILKESGADVILLQETYGASAAIAEELGYDYVNIGGEGNNLSIYSKYEILDSFSNDAILNSFCIGGVELKVGEQNVKVYNIWFSSGPDISMPFITADKSNEELIVWDAQYRGNDVDRALVMTRADMRDSDHIPLIMGGDYNSHSHLDWTEATKDMYQHEGRVIDWYVSNAMADLGFLDSYREVHADPSANLGETWTKTEGDNLDREDRIDYIYYQGKNIRASRSVVFEGNKGEELMMGDKSLLFASDHRPVMTTFQLHPRPLFDKVHLTNEDLQLVEDDSFANGESLSVQAKDAALHIGKSVRDIDCLQLGVRDGENQLSLTHEADVTIRSLKIADTVDVVFAHVDSETQKNQKITLTNGEGKSYVGGKASARIEAGESLSIAGGNFHVWEKAKLQVEGELDQSVASGDFHVWDNARVEISETGRLKVTSYVSHGSSLTSHSKDVEIAHYDARGHFLNPQGDLIENQADGRMVLGDIKVNKMPLMISNEGYLSLTGTLALTEKMSLVNNGTLALAGRVMIQSGSRILNNKKLELAPSLVFDVTDIKLSAYVWDRDSNQYYLQLFDGSGEHDLTSLDASNVASHYQDPVTLTANGGLAFAVDVQEYQGKLEKGKSYTITSDTQIDLSEGSKSIRILEIDDRATLSLSGAPHTLSLSHFLLGRGSTLKLSANSLSSDRFEMAAASHLMFEGGGTLSIKNGSIQGSVHLKDRGHLILGAKGTHVDDTDSAGVMRVELSSLTAEEGSHLYWQSYAPSNRIANLTLKGNHYQHFIHVDKSDAMAIRIGRLNLLGDSTLEFEWSGAYSSNAHYYIECLAGDAQLTVSSVGNGKDEGERHLLIQDASLFNGTVKVLGEGDGMPRVYLERINNQANQAPSFTGAIYSKGFEKSGDGHASFEKLYIESGDLRVQKGVLTISKALVLHQEGEVVISDGASFKLLKGAMFTVGEKSLTVQDDIEISDGDFEISVQSARDSRK